MRSRRVVVLLAALAVAVAACQGGPEPVEPDQGTSTSPANPAATGEPGPADLATPTPAPLVTIEPRISGNRGRGFVPLDNPEFIGAEAADLHPDELVLGYAIGGEARAYPVTMMRFHHIANDEIRGEPLLVTY